MEVHEAHETEPQSPEIEKIEETLEPAVQTEEPEQEAKKVIPEVKPVTKPEPVSNPDDRKVIDVDQSREEYYSSLSEVLPAEKMPSVTLKSGYQMPKLAFGTYKLRGESCYMAVRSALKIGFRHFDTGSFYENEEALGQAIRDSGVPREEIFVTSKIWRDAMTEEKAETAVEDIVRRLGIEYVDLILIHYPSPCDDFQPSLFNVHSKVDCSKARKDAWRGLEKAASHGWVRSIGVSNFELRHLEDILTMNRLPVCVNQIEGHPYYHPLASLKTFCSDKRIVVQNHTACSRGQAVTDPIIGEIAIEMNVKPISVILQWAMGSNMCPVIRASSHDHMVDAIQSIAEYEEAPMSTNFTVLLDTLDLGMRCTRLKPDTVP
ncbi:hypothetical protein PCE1_003679 [Barthelona sp. PCE]